jgi:hypothetical protein
VKLLYSRGLLALTSSIVLNQVEGGAVAQGQPAYPRAQRRTTRAGGDAGAARDGGSAGEGAARTPAPGASRAAATLARRHLRVEEVGGIGDSLNERVSC